MATLQKAHSKRLFPPADAGTSTSSDLAAAAAASTAARARSLFGQWRIAGRPLPAGSRLGLLGAYGLVVTESLLRVAQPAMIGLAVSDLLDSSVRGLLLFAVQHLLLTVVVAGRQMWGARVFSSLQTDLLQDRRCSHDNVCGDENRLRGAITRMERTIPDRLRRIVQTGGSLLLGWYDESLVPFCLLLVVPFGLLWAAYEPNLSQMSARLTEQERMLTDKGHSADTGRVQPALASLRTLRVRLGDSSAIRNALTELFVLGMLASAIVRFLGCGGSSPPAGDIVAVVCYLLLFVHGLRGRTDVNAAPASCLPAE